MANDGIVDRAMEANGYTINQNGVTNQNGAARPIEAMASIASVYLELLALPKLILQRLSWSEKLPEFLVGKSSWNSGEFWRISNSGPFFDPIFPILVPVPIRKFVPTTFTTFLFAN